MQTNLNVLNKSQPKPIFIGNVLIVKEHEKLHNRQISFNSNQIWNEVIIRCIVENLTESH